eukprot:2279636-Pleurochrysis_carterae.AAC.2
MHAVYLQINCDVLKRSLGLSGFILEYQITAAQDVGSSGRNFLFTGYALPRKRPRSASLLNCSRMMSGASMFSTPNEHSATLKSLPFIFWWRRQLDVQTDSFIPCPPSFPPEMPTPAPPPLLPPP